MAWVAKLNGLLLAGGLALLVGCSSAQPIAYQDPSETPPGPGLFTGSSGEVSVTLKPHPESAASASP